MMLSLLFIALGAWAEDNRFLILKETFARALQTASLTDLDLAGAPREKTCWLVRQTGEVQPFSLLRIEQVIEAAGPLLPEKRDIRAAGLFPQEESAEYKVLHNAFHQIQIATTSIELQIEVGETKELFGTPARYKLRKSGDYTLFELKTIDGSRRPPLHYGYCHPRVSLTPNGAVVDFDELHSR